MERDRTTTSVHRNAWTSASEYSSTPSPVSSLVSCDEYGDEDFLSQMDEKGIIGLRGGSPSVLEDLSCHLSELLDSDPFSQSIGDDRHSHTHKNNEYSISLEDWSEDDEEDQESFNIHKPIQHPSTDLLPGIMDVDIEEVKMPGNESHDRQRSINPQDIWMDCQDAPSHEEMECNHRTVESGTYSQNSRDEKNNAFSSSSFQSTPQIHIHPHLLEKTLQEVEIKDGMFTEFGGSNNSMLRHSRRTYQHVRLSQEERSVAESVNATLEMEQKSAELHQSHHQLPVSSPQTPSSNSAETGSRTCHRPSKTSHTDLNDVRNGQPSHALPDFSQVEPRVRFPKSIYKPLNSPPHKENSKAKIPVAIKSPPDFVKEELYNNTEEPLDAEASIDSQEPLGTTMNEELQCSLQASIMVQQLQEDYSRLLTKYAEAENTIDRLRLEARVCLHSDPKPSKPVLFGVLKEGSKVMTLSFPQAQVAKLGADDVQPTPARLNSDSFSFSCCEFPATAPLTEAFAKQMARFQLQVNEFEKLLKCQRLNYSEQMQGVSQLTDAQELIERAYLAARGKHQQLQKQTLGKSTAFDPDRELESLIFQTGIQLEELKEWIEQSEYSQGTEHSPRNGHALQSGALLTENESRPEKAALAAHADVLVGVEVISVSRESDGDKKKGKEEKLPCVLHPLDLKHHVQKDFGNLMDQYQNLKDLSRLLEPDQVKVDHNSLELRDCSLSDSVDGMEREQQWRHKDEWNSNDPLQSLPLADSPAGTSSSSQVCNSMEALTEASVPAAALPRKWETVGHAASSVRSQNSLGQRLGRGRKVLKVNDVAMTAQLQEAVVTPETDSGFLGSGSSRVTPAVQSPVQQRVAVRETTPSASQENGRINPMSGSPEHTQPSSIHAIPFGGAPGSLGSGGGAVMRHFPSLSGSSSPLRWPNTPLQPWPVSRISELEQHSKSACSLSEDGARQGYQHAQPANLDPSYHRSSSLTTAYHCGDHIKTQSSGQPANHHEAIESLQAEVLRLRQHLEGSLRKANLPHRARAPPSPWEDTKDRRSHTSAPHPRQCDFRTLEGKMGSKREPRGHVGTVTEGQERMVPRRSASFPCFRPEPDTSTVSDTQYTQSEDMTQKDISESPVIARITQRVRAETGWSPKAYLNRQKCSVSAERSNMRNYEATVRRRPVHLCFSCLVQQNRPSECHAINVSSLTHTRSDPNYCPLCGATKKETVPATANRTSMQKGTRPVRSLHMQTQGVYLSVAAPPPWIGSVPVLQCVAVCPSVLYYPSPVLSTSYQKPL